GAVGAHRLRRHGGDTQAGQGCGSGSDRQAVDDGNDRGGTAGLRYRLPADQRHAGFGRIPAAGGTEPVAALPPGNHRRTRPTGEGGGMNKLDTIRPISNEGRLHTSTPHDSAAKQVAGRAEYIDDLPEPEGM